MNAPLYKSKRLDLLFFVYWILLFYIIAALIWWFIALNNLNHQMAQYKMDELNTSDKGYAGKLAAILDVEKRKSIQYIGEGSIFLLLILAGAVFIFRAVRNQLKASQQQQNFMMAITHELKTPISVTKLNLETLQRRKLEEPQQQKLIKNSIQETDRLNALCNNMLLASQFEAGRFSVLREDIDLSLLVNECVNHATNRFSGRVIVAHIADDLFIQGDMLMLQMAVNNLLENAIKYSPENSAIKVELGQKEKQVHLSVTDQGKGIGPEEKKKIFEKYYRIGNEATRSAKGTGLGLYLTRKIVEQHKARIFVSDNTPAGTNFTIVFG